MDNKTEYKNKLFEDLLWNEMSNQIDNLTVSKKLLKSKLNDSIIKLDNNQKHLFNQINNEQKLMKEQMIHVKQLEDKLKDQEIKL